MAARVIRRSGSPRANTRSPAHETSPIPSAEATDLVHAIRSAQADAIVQESPGGLQLRLLHGAEEPYQLMVATMGEGASVIDVHGVVHYANPAFEQWIGGPDLGARGRPLASYFSEMSRKAFEEVLGELASHGGTMDVQLVGAASPKPVHLSARPIHTDGFDGVICILTDYSDLQRLTDELEQRVVDRTSELTHLNQAMSEVMSMVNHEFRNALVGIQGFSEMMRLQDLTPDEVRSIAGDIYSEAVRLTRMINTMLEMDRMEAGRVRLDLKPVDVNSLIEAVAGRARRSQGKTTIVTRLDRSLPLLLADADRLTQVMSNLLGNAVKYSPDGGHITIFSRLEGAQLHVRVRDRGVGIAPEDVGRLFGRYERFANNRGAKTTGTGLGLAIAREIVQLHGGRIWAESVPGRGSTFHFTIPRLNPPARSTEPQPVASR